MHVVDGEGGERFAANVVDRGGGVAEDAAALLVGVALVLRDELDRGFVPIVLPKDSHQIADLVDLRNGVLYDVEFRVGVVQCGEDVLNPSVCCLHELSDIACDVQVNLARWWTVL